MTIIRKTNLGDTITTTFDDIGSQGFVEHITIEESEEEKVLKKGQRDRLKMLRQWEEDVKLIAQEPK